MTLLHLPDDLGEHDVGVLRALQLEVHDVVVMHRHPPVIEALETGACRVDHTVRYTHIKISKCDHTTNNCVSYMCELHVVLRAYSCTIY